MAHASAPATMLTRRALARRLAAAAAALGAGATAAGAAAPPPADPALREAALRGLARALSCGDPVAEAAASAALGRLAGTDPEGAALVRIFRAFDQPQRPRPWEWEEGSDPGGEWPAAADPALLELLHAAVAACRPVAFGYTDLSGRRSRRSVLPLALVHPPQGVKLLAWCDLRGGYRQFFVRAMTGVVPSSGSFAERRAALLEGLAAEADARG